MSSGGGDQEVVQKSEPFPQQLPYVQQAFNMANARTASLTPRASYNPDQPGGGYNPYSPHSPGGINVPGVGFVPWDPGTGGNPGPNNPYAGRGGRTNNAATTTSVGTPQFIPGGMPGPGGYPSPGGTPPGIPGGTPAGSGENPSGLTTDNFSNVFYDRARDFGLPTLEFYPGSTVANQSNDTLTAQQLARGGAVNIAGLNESGTGAFNRLLNQGAFSNSALQSLLQNPDPSRDPTVERFAQAATRPLEAQRDSLLAADDDRAIAQGAFGGSRQQLNRGSIRNDFAQRVGDVRAGIYNQAYQQQLQAQQNALGIAAGADANARNSQLSALGQLGALNAQQTAPSDIFSRVGAQNENYRQSLIDAERERFEFEQSAPDLAINQFSNLINQFSGPTSSQRVVSGGGPSALASAVGLGLTGAGAYGLFGNRES